MVICGFCDDYSSVCQRSLARVQHFRTRTEPYVHYRLIKVLKASALLFGLLTPSLIGFLVWVGILQKFRGEGVRRFYGDRSEAVSWLSHGLRNENLEDFTPLSKAFYVRSAHSRAELTPQTVHWTLFGSAVSLHGDRSEPVRRWSHDSWNGISAEFLRHIFAPKASDLWNIDAKVM